MFCILSEPQEPLYEPHVQLHLSGLSGTPVSHMSHYVSHVKIYPVLNFWCPQSADLMSMACISSLAMCRVFPVSPGATILQNHVHLAILGLLHLHWAMGATIWTTSRSIHFQPFYVPNEPGRHFIWMSHTSSRSMHYVSPLSRRSHQISTPFTFSYFGRSGPLWAIGAIIWTMPRSIHFQTFYVPNEPWEPLHINVTYI